MKKALELLRDNKTTQGLRAALDYFVDRMIGKTRKTPLPGFSFRVLTLPSERFPPYFAYNDSISGKNSMFLD